MPARNTAGVRVRHWKRPIPMATEKKINILSFYKRTDYSEMKHGINHIQRPEFSRKIIPHVYKLLNLNSLNKPKKYIHAFF